jgi:osmotically inducible protein OsmC
MSKIETVLLTGKTHTTVSRPDGRLDIALSASGAQANPHRFADIASHPTAEQFFAGAWSACYIGALGLAAQAKKVKLPADLSVDVEVDLGMTGDAYLIQARFNVAMPGVPHDLAEAIAHAGHDICPYSKATRGNIDVTVNVVAA